MKQGEIWLTDLNPVQGKEQIGFCPVVILSGKVLNTYMEIVIVCQLTSSVKGYKGNVILEPDNINNLDVKSEILTFQIRSLSKQRLKKKIGLITGEQLNALKIGLNYILKY